MFLRFDFTVVDPQKGFMSRCNGMFMQSDMNVVVIPRTTFESLARVLYKRLGQCPVQNQNVSPYRSTTSMRILCNNAAGNRHCGSHGSRNHHNRNHHNRNHHNRNHHNRNHRNDNVDLGYNQHMTSPLDRNVRSRVLSVLCNSVAG